MGDYKTTRLLDCCALDRIWSSTQRLENLDWFGPEMPYVQYGGGVLALLLSSPSAQNSEGSLQAFQAVCFLGVEPLGVQPFPTWGASPFIVQGGPPCLHISIVVSWLRLGVLHLRQSLGPTQSVGSGDWRGLSQVGFFGQRVV